MTQLISSLTTTPALPVPPRPPSRTALRQPLLDVGEAETGEKREGVRFKGWVVGSGRAGEGGEREQRGDFRSLAVPQGSGIR